ncbi:hypothetical protein CsatA_013900 [Cannabis sativa]
MDPCGNNVTWAEVCGLKIGNLNHNVCWPLLVGVTFCVAASYQATLTTLNPWEASIAALLMIIAIASLTIHVVYVQQTLKKRKKVMEMEKFTGKYILNHKTVIDVKNILVLFWVCLCSSGVYFFRLYFEILLESTNVVASPRSDLFLAVIHVAWMAIFIFGGVAAVEFNLNPKRIYSVSMMEKMIASFDDYNNKHNFIISNV